MHISGCLWLPHAGLLRVFGILANGGLLGEQVCVHTGEVLCAVLTGFSTENLSCWLWIDTVQFFGFKYME